MRLLKNQMKIKKCNCLKKIKKLLFLTKFQAYMLKYYQNKLMAQDGQNLRINFPNLIRASVFAYSKGQIEQNLKATSLTYNQRRPCVKY